MGVPISHPSVQAMDVLGGLRTEWMTAPELVGRLEIGDLVEFNREDIYQHWAVVVQRENHVAYIAHLSGGDEDFAELGFPLQARALTRASSFSDLRAKVLGSAKGGTAEVKCDELITVARDSLCRLNNSLDGKCDPLPPNTVVDRALLQLGRRKYNILFSNCEHFVKWCRYGSKRSDQASRGKSLLLGLTAATLSGSVSAGLAAGLVGYGVCKVGQHVRHHISNRYSLDW